MKDKYYKFLKGLQLRHFAPEEIIAQSERVRGKVSNTLPPEELWPYIVPTLWVADQLRRHLGYPLIITSAYRSEKYNKKVGGAIHSQHKNNTALDLIPRVTPKEAFTSLKKLRDAGAFKGGLGIYTSFVHIDTRGRNATWTG
tara:strand:+ start:466 stop:891 length:426 start_codon:yes stop_codon:yes gene_type:complete